MLSLHTRFLLLAAALILVASTTTWFSFHWMGTGIVDSWGQRVAELQVRYDSARVLQALEREIALARQLSNSSLLKRWALNPDDAQIRRMAMAELDAFRRNFRDQNCFVALNDAQQLYYADSDNSYNSNPVRYDLTPGQSSDQWFYRFLKSERDYRLSVGQPRDPGSNMLWIDVLIRHDNRVIGVVGTALHLDAFLDDIVDVRQAGVHSMLIDEQGEIQLVHDQTRQVAAAKANGEPANLLIHLLGTERERQAVREIMSGVREQSRHLKVVKTTFIELEGERYLLGMTFLPTLGWYEVSMVDLERLMPLNRFAPALVTFGIILLACLFIMHQTLRRLILNPLQGLEAAMKQVGRGNLSEPKLPRASGEIKGLIQHFDSMAAAIRSHTRNLESEVRERTEALHKLARIDSLTELINRRGMNEIIQESIQRANREGQSFAIIWLDLDHFKDLNDRLGHAIGDEALKLVAQVLRDNLRPYDSAARWGGDEFLVLLSPCDQVTLISIGERIRANLADAFELEDWPTTASLGGYLAQPGDTKDAVLQHADEAMYRAKMAGRNRFRLADSDVTY